MEDTDSLVKGGVLIVHQINEGKHQYQVENVMKRRKGEKMFVRRGDKLMQVNGMDLDHLTPEELAQMLAEGNPMLTVHKASQGRAHPPQPSPGEEVLHPVSKETITLSFSMEMKWGGDSSETDGVQKDGEEDGDPEEVETCPTENGGSSGISEEGDMLVISMVRTTISVVRGRGCDVSSPCGGCNGTGCVFNEVVVVSESSKVVLVPRGCLKQAKQANYEIRHAASHQYLRGLCQQNSVYASPNPEKITVYTYKSSYFDWSFKKAVVLNFTGSNCFLRCCREGGRVLLRAEVCEKQRLKQISRSDESALSYVFFMKSDSSLYKFESALHQGWFIQINNTQAVNMAERDGRSEDHSFYFIIQKQP